MLFDIVSTDPLALAKGNMDSFSLFAHRDPKKRRLSCYPKDWVVISQIELEIEFDKEEVLSIALKGLEREEKKQIADHQHKLDLLAEAKASLLSITYQPEED